MNENSLEASTTAQMALAMGDFEQVIKLLKGTYRSKNKSMLLNAYFFNADFENCYKLAESMANDYSLEDVYKEEAENMVDMLENIDFDFIPSITNYSAKQSVEDSNENYPDAKELSQVYNANETTFARFFADIDSKTKSYDPEVRAHAWFIGAEFFFMQAEFDNAINCYLNAIDNNPNKALYYGYCAQAMNRSNSSTMSSIILANRAIELDPLNPRWYWIKGHTVFRLSNDIHPEIFVQTAVNHWKKARSLCKPNQVSFKNAINILFDQLNIERV